MLINEIIGSIVFNRGLFLFNNTWEFSCSSPWFLRKNRLILFWFFTFKWDVHHLSITNFLIVLHKVIFYATKNPLKCLPWQNKQFQFIWNRSDGESSLDIFKNCNFSKVVAFIKQPNLLVLRFLTRIYFDTFTFPLLNNKEFISSVSLMEYKISLSKELDL